MRIKLCIMGLLAVLIFAIQGCRKDFYRNSSTTHQLATEDHITKFLTAPENAGLLVRKVIADITVLQKEYNFLQKFIPIAGTPVWEQSISNQPIFANPSSAIIKSNSLNRILTNAPTTKTDFLFIPLIDSVTREVKTILQCYVKDDTSFQYRIIHKATILALPKKDITSSVNNQTTVALFAAFENRVNPNWHIRFPAPYFEFKSPYFGKDNSVLNSTKESTMSDKQKGFVIPQNGDVYFVEVGNFRVYYIYHSSNGRWSLLHIGQVEDMQGDLGGGGTPYYPVFYPDPLPNYDPGTLSSDPNGWPGTSPIYPPEWIPQESGAPPFTPPGPGEFEELPQEPGYIPVGLNSDAALNYILVGLKNNPTGLLNLAGTSDSLKANWLKLAKYKVSSVTSSRLDSIKGEIAIWAGALGSYSPTQFYTDVARIQSIDDATSSITNMDYFPVVVTVLPVINNHQLTANEFLTMIRTNINGFVDTTITSFAPFNHGTINDQTRWQSSTYNGSIVELDIPGDNGAVIASQISGQDYKWVFTTIHDPYNGDHPVSGNREFGYALNTDGSYTFYTSGVDRLTNLSGTLLQATIGVPFNTAESLWTSFQNGIHNFIQSHSGASYRPAPSIIRPDWDAVRAVMNGALPLSALGQ